MIKSVHVESGHLTSTDSSLGMRTLPSRRFSLLDTKESLTGSSTHTPLLSSLPDHVSSSLGHGQVVYCVRRETFVVQSKSDVPKVPVGCSEGPSRMFRRSQSDVPKVPVGCLEGPSRMFGSPRCSEVPVGRSEIVRRWDCHLVHHRHGALPCLHATLTQGLYSKYHHLYCHAMRR